MLPTRQWFLYASFAATVCGRFLHGLGGLTLLARTPDSGYLGEFQGYFPAKKVCDVFVTVTRYPVDQTHNGCAQSAKKEIFNMQQLPTQWLAQPSLQPNNDVTVRPIQPDDAGLIYDMHQRLSPDSLYYRYLQVRKPTLDEVAAICYLDPVIGAGFVATTQRNAEIIVGIAYYVREVHAQQPTAEPGILVEDGFQGQGIGRMLWQQMQQHAMDNRIQRLRVLFHRTNQRMARLVQSGGLPYQAQASDGLSEYLVALGGLPLPLIAGSSLDRGSMGEGNRYYSKTN